MAIDNTATVVGNLTRDPKLSFTANGTAVCEVGLALNSRKKEGDKWVDGPGKFLDVTVWGQMGENVAECLGKGSRVIIVGRIDYRSWEDKQTGDKRSKVSLVADSIGPDLKWATAEVVRNERRAPEERAPAPSHAYDPDEAPFS